jgi:prevent-host-death family protein
MLQEINSYDASTKLLEILRRVQQGEAFTITNRGKAIADLVPSRTNDAAKIDTAITNIMEAKKHTLSDVALKELKLDGRK